MRREGGVYTAPTISSTPSVATSWSITKSKNKMLAMSQYSWLAYPVAVLCIQYFPDALLGGIDLQELVGFWNDPLGGRTFCEIRLCSCWNCISSCCFRSLKSACSTLRLASWASSSVPYILSLNFKLFMHTYVHIIIPSIEFPSLPTLNTILSWYSFEISVGVSYKYYLTYATFCVQHSLK